LASFPPLVPSRYFDRKFILDHFVAALLLLPSLLLMAILIIVVRLTSRGPAIYAQRRVGRNGRIFRMYKIRSMAHNAEAITGPAWTQTADPRVTPIGHILRKFHFDELPQLFNVLRGERSLVGPRPERPEFVEILCRKIPDYRSRLGVPPGITGLAQINLPPDSDIDSVRRKLILDREYIQTASVWLDLKLILCTAMRISKLPCAKLLGVDRIVELPRKEADSENCRAAGTVVTFSQLKRQLDANARSGNGAARKRRQPSDPHKCRKSQPT
jgi:lipopolysaccharide/colanic/teichoic acid biosynthesis glycosyltransferase